MASVLKVDKLDPQSGTDLEIGSSGDTITIPSGATFTQSGTMNASAITAGTVATARLGTGTASSSTVLYGDQTYKAEPSGTALTGSTNNTITTVTGADAIQGETNLTFDGTTLAVTGTVEPSGDTSSGDNAAIGYTATEGLILTGQGSTSDVTIKNDADAAVISIPTGTTDVNLSGATTTGFVIETGNTTNANKNMGNILSTSTDVFQFRREDFCNYIEVTLSSYLGYRKEVFRSYQSVATTSTKIYGTDSMVGSMVNVSGTTWKYVITTSGNGYSTSVNLFFNGAKDSYVWL